MRNIVDFGLIVPLQSLYDSLAKNQRGYDSQHSFTIGLLSYMTIIYLHS